MPTPGPHSVAFAISGPITRADLPGLCTRVCGLLSGSGAQIAFCDVTGVQSDAVTVDALARLQLAAQRLECRVLLQHASPDLRALVAFMGLTDVLPADAPNVSRRVSRTRKTARPDERKGDHMAENGNGRMMFVNLAVDDLDRSVEFFTGLGFTFDPRFTDETATAMVVNDQAVVMLLVRDRFKDFTEKELADPGVATEAIMAVSATSREDVDAFADKALDIGGAPANEAMDMGFMYGRSFQDPDGHIWEIVWMDPSALEQSPTGA
jgi:predicted lactoylglutathione lyase/ABC-type transporter Mla MlaB component